MAFDPVSIALEVGSKVIDRFFPDPAARDAAKLKLLEMQQTGELAQLAAETDLAKGQLAINAEEAKSADPFTSRARPFIMWVCGFAFAYHFIVQPLLVFGMAAFGHVVPLPAFDMDALNTVLMGLLGLSGMRSFDKLKGTSK